VAELSSMKYRDLEILNISFMNKKNYVRSINSFIMCENLAP